MDVVRKERNLLLLREDDRKINHPLELQKENVLQPPSQTSEPLGLEDILRIYEGFCNWIQSQAQNLLSNSEFKYSTNLKKEEENDNNNNNNSTVKRTTLGFETLSPPTKNLILALGDVQLQKGSREEFYMNDIFYALSFLSKKMWKSLNAGRLSLQDLISETATRREALHKKMLADFFSWQEYTQACNDLDEAQGLLGFEHERSNTNNNDMESYLYYCEKNKKIDFRLHSLSLSLKNQDTGARGNPDINFSSELDERFKLRMQKNEISKQKLFELSNKSTKTSNLAIALETLRLAENEIDDNILSITNTMLSSSAVKVKKENENIDQEKEKHSSSSMLQDEEKLIKIKDANKKALITLNCVGVKIRLLKKSLDEEIDEEIEKYQKQIYSSINKDCISFRGRIFDALNTIKTKYLSEIDKLERTEKTLKDELQSLLRIVRNDSRGVDQCVRSLSETARKRSDQIQNENFRNHVNFLERLSSSGVQ